MKKLTKILIIITSIFIGLNGVNAEKETYTAKCTNNQSEPTANMCTFTCVVKYTEENEDKEFIYEPVVQFRDGNFSVFNAKGNAISKGSDVEYSKFAVTPNSTIKENGTSYEYLGDKITTVADMDRYFVNNGSLKCKKIVSTLTFETKESYKYVPEIVGAKKIHTLTRTFDFKMDPDQLQQDIEDSKNQYNDNSVCGLLGGENSATVSIIKKVYGYIKVIIPILIIALGIADFIKVIMSGKDDDMKKALNNFIKRIILAIVFILLPILISLIIDLSGLATQYPSLNGGIKAIVCIFK